MGTNTGTIIDINGKRYDAVTGTFLGASTTPQKPAAAPKVASRTARASVDGFRRQGTAMDMVSTKSAHAPAAHVTPHQPQKGKTLMRTAVKKPQIVAPSRIKSQTRTDILARVPQQTVAPKVSHATVNPHRLKKASLMSKSPAVSKYAVQSPVQKLQHGATARYAQQPVRQELSSDIKTSSRQQTAAMPHIPVSQHRQAPKQPDIFEQALAKATSHEQTYSDKRTKKRSRWTSAVSVTMGLLLVVGIVAYMNAPVLSMRLASSRAGFAAKLPGYSPAGFTFGNLSYGPGNVTVSYTAGGSTETAERKFDITQRESDWDSQALLTNFVASANKAYQTYERAGRTIYFYGNNTATWVDSGVWYTVNGNNALSKNQLLDMAGSL